MCKVVHCKKENFDIYIGRPSKWGNPYSHLDDSISEFKVDTRQESIDKYEKYLLNNKELMDSLPELMYKTIGCWCVPKYKCHGHVLKKYVDQLENIDKRNKLINE
jgi:hypothetical protein